MRRKFILGRASGSARGGARHRHHRRRRPPTRREAGRPPAIANVGLAEAAGYEEFLDCFDSEAGGMGQHFVNFGLLDTTVQRQKPEAMVYQVDESQLRLVAVEYLVPIADWTEDHPPRLFGRHFHPNEELGVYVLHAWIFKRNPAGLFTDYNPNVPACP